MRIPELVAEILTLIGGCLLIMYGFWRVQQGALWAWLLVGTGIAILWLVDLEGEEF